MSPCCFEREPRLQHTAVSGLRLGRLPSRLSGYTGPRATQSAAAFALVLLARLDAAEGRFSQCDEHAEEALAFAGGSGADAITTAAEAALGLAALGRDDPDVAATLLDRVGARVGCGGLIEPNVVPFAGDHIHSLLLAGRRDDAVAAVGDLERRATASGRRFGLGVLWRGRGLTSENGAQAERSFHRSLETPEPIGRVFEEARTRLALGELLRRSRRRGEARTSLRHALATFEQIGAVPWAERARRELRLAEAASLRTHRNPGDERLTEQEFRVACLAAGGNTNNEIASALTVSPKTVEFHLANAYRKLEIRRRVRHRGGTGWEGLHVEVVPGLHSVDLGMVNAYLLEVGEEVVVIDTGVPGSEHAILEALAAIGRAPDNVKNIVVTHLHPDHAGALAELALITGATTWMHAADGALVARGHGARPMRPAPGAANAEFFAQMDPDIRIRPVRIDRTLADGNGSTFAPLRVVHAPGHTVGHLALLAESDGATVLLAADAASNIGGRLQLSIAYEDLDEGRRSLERLAGEAAADATLVCFGHGDPVLADEFRRHFARPDR